MLNATLIEKLLYKISEKTKMGAKSRKPHNPYTTVGPLSLLIGIPVIPVWESPGVPIFPWSSSEKYIPY